MSEDGVERSAILLMSLGEAEAVEVFKHLGPREVQKLGVAMAKLSNITREQMADVLREFHVEAQQQTSIASAPDQYLRAVLTGALGNDKAGVLIDRIFQGTDNACHIGGLLTGLLIGGLIAIAAPDRNQLGRRFIILAIVAALLYGAWLLISR